MVSTVKIETVNGVYEVKKPSGKVGAMSMAILSKLAGHAKQGTEYGEDEKLISPRQLEGFGGVFMEWAEKILPHIVLDSPYKKADGVTDYEDIPGEDQLAIFTAVSSHLAGDKEFFRIIK